MAAYDNKVFTGDKLKPVLDNLATEFTQKVSWGICSTAAATTSKTVTVGSKKSFSLSDGAVIAVTFTYAVPASATLNVNSSGGKSIKFRGSNITANVIDAGATVFLKYSSTGTCWNVIDTNSWREVKVGGTQKIAPTSNTALDFVGDGTVTVSYTNNQVKISGASPDISSKQDNITWKNSSGTAVLDAGAAVTVKAGSNVQITNSSTTEVTISATDTTYGLADPDNGTAGLVKLAGKTSTSVGYGKVVIQKGGSSSESQNDGKLYYKLYDNVTGTNTDGPVAQSAVKSALDLKAPLTSPALTGTPTSTTAATGTNTTQIATTAFVQQEISAAQTGAALFQGSVGGASDTIKKDTETPSTGEKNFRDLTDYKKGWYWVVAAAGTYCGTDSSGTGGYSCEAGDFIFCIKDYTSSTYSASDFSVVQNNIDIITTSEVTALWNAAFT